MSGDIHMRGIVDFYLPKYRQSRDTFAWGDCTFKIGKIELPLKFRETTWNMQIRKDHHVLLHFHARNLDRSFYAAEYESAGIYHGDINVKFLTYISGIAEFPLICHCHALGEEGLFPPQIINHYGSFEIQELSFSDEESVLALPDTILMHYTESVRMEAAMIRQLVGMLRH